MSLAFKITEVTYVTRNCSGSSSRGDREECLSFADVGTCYVLGMQPRCTTATCMSGHMDPQVDHWLVLCFL
jgi:hypothetical protein